MESRLGTVMVNFTPKPQNLSSTLLSCPYMSLPSPTPLPVTGTVQRHHFRWRRGSPGCSSRMPGNLETKSMADLYREPL